jgi:hypothetical protein
VSTVADRALAGKIRSRPEECLVAIPPRIPFRRPLKPIAITENRGALGLAIGTRRGPPRFSAHRGQVVTSWRYVWVDLHLLWAQRDRVR